MYYATVMVLTTAATVLGVMVLRIHHQVSPFLILVISAVQEICNFEYATCLKMFLLVHHLYILMSGISLLSTYCHCCNI